MEYNNKVHFRLTYEEKNLGDVGSNLNYSLFQQHTRNFSIQHPRTWYMYICIYVYKYIYMYIWREGERERGRWGRKLKPRSIIKLDFYLKSSEACVRLLVKLSISFNKPLSRTSASKGWTSSDMALIWNSTRSKRISERENLYYVMYQKMS